MEAFQRRAAELRRSFMGQRPIRACLSSLLSGIESASNFAFIHEVTSNTRLPILLALGCFLPCSMTPLRAVIASCRLNQA